MILEKISVVVVFLEKVMIVFEKKYLEVKIISL